MDDVRREVIAIQRRLVERSREQLVAATAGERAELRRYHEALHRSTSGFERLSTRAELLEAAAASRVVFVGDFHTLRQAQRTPLRLMDQLAALPAFVRRERRIVLGLEMVRSEHQRALDRFLAGGIDESAFLKATRYRATWSFPWSSYRPLLDYARSRRIPVLALNSEPAGPAERLARRDRHAARILARHAARTPDACAVVLFGDLHLADDRLPARFRAEAARAGAESTCTVVHQNVGSLYWRLAEVGLEQFAEVLRLGEDADPAVRGRFCVMNATPLARIQSHLYWEERNDAHALERWGFAGGPGLEETGYLTDQVVELIHALVEFLELPLPDLNRLTVRAERFETRIRPKGAAREADTRIFGLRRARITDADVIFLSAGSVEHAAEQAAHFVHARASGVSVAEERGPRERVYFLALRHALGYLGSKFFNHLRTAYLPADYARLVAQSRGRRARSPRLLRVEALARLVARQVAREDAAFEAERVPAPQRVPADEVVPFARSLGYMLGERLYSALIQGFIAKDDVRELYRTPLARPGDAEDLYLTWRRRLHRVKDFYTSREERL